MEHNPSLELLRHTDKLNLTLNEVEVKCLQLVMAEASHVRFTDVKTREDMQAFVERVTYAVNVQMPGADMKLEYGRFY